MRLGLGLFTALLVLAIAPGGAFGYVGTLDQENPINPDGYEGIPAPGFYGQTFTAGASGYLTEVELYGRNMEVPNAVGPNAAGPNIYMTVYAQSAGLPTGPALASATGVAATTEGWILFTFAGPAQVVSGTSYALAFNMDSGTGIVFGNDYAGGGRFAGNGVETPMTREGDWAFRTYVSTNAPSTPPPTSSGPTDGGNGSDRLPLIVFAGAFAGVGIGALAVRRRGLTVR